MDWLLALDLDLMRIINVQWTHEWLDAFFLIMASFHLWKWPLLAGAIALLIWGSFKARVFLALMLLCVVIGDTGIMQTFEIALHIWNRWAELHGDERIWQRFKREKPADWTDLQVVGAKRGMAISHAGVGSHVTATVLMDPDHLIN